VLLRKTCANVWFIYSVTDLQPDDTEENPFYYTFKVQCTGCREVHANWVSVSRFVRSSAYAILSICCGGRGGRCEEIPGNGGEMPGDDREM
jgi:hypothetical protein